MNRHTHPTERRTADVVPFPPLLAHWPADAVALSVLAPLPACCGLLVWRPARAALFWAVTDDQGRIAEAWPLRYSATEDQVQADAQHRPCFQYPEERQALQPKPAIPSPQPPTAPAMPTRARKAGVRTHGAPSPDDGGRAA